MCLPNGITGKKELPNTMPEPSVGEKNSSTKRLRRRRNQRERQHEWEKEKYIFNDSTSSLPPSPTHKRIVKKKKKSNMTAKHENDAKSGGMDALIPSAIGAVVLIFVVMAKMGFRGRATVAGIDLGTTNSVVCVQAPSKGVGDIVCIPDPATNSPVVPSVVSFLDNHHLKFFRLSKEEKESAPDMMPHPVDVVVGRAAKDRINSHPHHTIYHAKRIIGREYRHESVDSLQGEVGFKIVENGQREKHNEPNSESNKSGLASFSVPYHMPTSSSVSALSNAILTPSEIGSYVIHHLRTITRNYLQHDNIQSAVIAIPAKFDSSQRDATIRAYELAGMKVARVLEEPTAAALAYGLHKRDDVHYVLVYDFGGGTLDLSLLYIGEGGYIDVLGSDGDEQLGGADFDAAIAHWLLEKQGGEDHVKSTMASVAKLEKELQLGADVDNASDIEDILEDLCPKLKEIPLCTWSSFHVIGERMKIGLSKYPNDPDAVVEEKCLGIPPTDSANIPSTADELCATVKPVTMSLTLKNYDLAVEHLYKRSIIPIQRLLNDLDLKKDEIDEIVMVGGTTRMPQIRELVRTALNKDHLNTHIDPDLTVAYGAASVID